MLQQRTFLLAAAAVLVGCLLAPLLDSRAGDKKGEKKKQPKAVQIFSKTDALTEKDEKDTNTLVARSPRKVYKVKLTEGKTYQIDLKSKAFDAFLRLENAAGKEIAFNDDAPGEKTLDSRIVYKAAKTDEYRIIATSFDSMAGKLTGKFTLTVVEADELPSVSVFKAKAIDLKMKDGKARHEGALTDKDASARNHYYMLFTVKLEEGKTYRIEQRHNGDDPKFDAFLFLEDADGNTLASDDDGAGGYNARIDHKAAKTAVYRIIATTLPANQTGKFVLEVSMNQPKDEKKQSRLEPEPKLLQRVGQTFLSAKAPFERAGRQECRPHVEGREREG